MIEIIIGRTEGRNKEQGLCEREKKLNNNNKIQHVVIERTLTPSTFVEVRAKNKEVKGSTHPSSLSLNTLPPQTL